MDVLTRVRRVIHGQPADIYELDFPVNLEQARDCLGPNKVICGNVSTITDLLEGTPDQRFLLMGTT